jgi:hypothetical protein
MLFGSRLIAALSGVFLLGLTSADACPCCVRTAPPPTCCFAAAAAPPACCVAAAADKDKDKPAADKDKPAAAAADDEAKIKANLAKLSDDDRKLAEAQKWCAVETDDRLGSMGVPVKVMVKDQPVFLCCKGCVDKAKADPDKTLATVKELKAKAAKPSDK